MLVVLVFREAVWYGGRLVAAVWSRLVACDLVVYCVVVGILGAACYRGCNAL